jgi:hypothetical protein
MDPVLLVVRCPGGSPSVGVGAMPSPDPSTGPISSPSVALSGSPGVEPSFTPSPSSSTRRSGPSDSPSAAPNALSRWVA